MDSFRWADINTYLAVNAHVLVDFCFFILQCNCRCRTFIHTRLAPGTFCNIYNCYQIVHSTVIFRQIQKIGFDIYRKKMRIY